jgi:hypothetical protein
MSVGDDYVPEALSRRGEDVGKTWLTPEQARWVADALVDAAAVAEAEA